MFIRGHEHSPNRNRGGKRQRLNCGYLFYPTVSHLSCGEKDAWLRRLDQQTPVLPGEPSHLVVRDIAPQEGCNDGAIAFSNETCWGQCDVDPCSNSVYFLDRIM